MGRIGPVLEKPNLIGKVYINAQQIIIKHSIMDFFYNMEVMERVTRERFAGKT